MYISVAAHLWITPPQHQMDEPCTIAPYCAFTHFSPAVAVFACDLWYKVTKGSFCLVPLLNSRRLCVYRLPFAAIKSHNCCEQVVCFENVFVCRWKGADYRLAVAVSTVHTGIGNLEEILQLHSYTTFMDIHDMIAEGSQWAGGQDDGWRFILSCSPVFLCSPVSHQPR